MYLWLDQFWEIVQNTHEDRQSESELIHSGVVKPKKWIKFDSLSLSKNSCRGEHCSPVPVCLWKIFPGKRVAAPSRRATNGRPYTFNRPRMWFFDTLSESNLIHSACQKITFLAYWMCRGDHWSPADLAQQRVFPERFFTDKRARASNARPYKSFLTNWVNQIWFTFSVLPPQSESVLIHFGGPRAYFAQSLRIGLIISTLPFRATSLFRITLVLYKSSIYRPLSSGMLQ